MPHPRVFDRTSLVLTGWAPFTAVAVFAAVTGSAAPITAVW
jgi:hypothetical protein